MFARLLSWLFFKLAERRLSRSRLWSLREMTRNAAGLRLSGEGCFTSVAKGPGHYELHYRDRSQTDCFVAEFRGVYARDLCWLLHVSLLELPELLKE